MTSDTLIAARPAGLRQWRWRMAFAGSMFATAGIMLWTNRPWPTGLLLLLLPILFAAPMMREARRKREAEGEASEALARFDRRRITAVFAYIGCMAVAANLGHAAGRGSDLLWLIALPPILPFLWLIWAMERYIAEEADEYLRHRAVTAALIGLAATLALANVWGTLEIFALVPHAGAWWAIPVFFVTADSARGWLTMRGR